MDSITAEAQKPTVDFGTGKNRSDSARSLWNGIFFRHSDIIRFEPIHKHMRIMTPAELIANNTMINRITRIPGAEEAVGLDWFAFGEGLKRLHIVPRCSKSSDIFYKLPGDVKKSWEDFIERVLYHAYFLILKFPEWLHYRFIKGSEFEWDIRTSKGNENRVYMKSRGKTINPTGKHSKFYDGVNGSSDLLGSHPRLADVILKELKK